MLRALADWVERGTPPVSLTVVEQGVEPSFPIFVARPLCEWPGWPHYNGGDVKQAASFSCGD